MMDHGVLDLHLGDRLRLRRAHPCGGREWVVDRLGADIGITCRTCGRRVLIPRRQLERRIASREPGATEPSSLVAAALRRPGAGA
jgi:hypothetical protein